MTDFDYASRQRRLAELVTASEWGSLVTTSPPDIAWVCGLETTNAALVIVNEPVIVTDGRYAEQARGTGLAVVVDRDVDGAATRILAAADRERVDDGEQGVIAGLRAIKDAQEIAAIEAATQISVAALRSLLSEISVGDTELGIARSLEFALWRYGASDRSFPTIVASGPNCAVPHHRPTDRELAPGDLLKIDFGAQYRGYHSDVTRTFVVGAQASTLQREIYGLVAAAASAARSLVRDGTAIAAVDACAREIIAEAGYGEHFVHGLGHGLGLEVHEAPLLAARTEGTLSAGNVVTIEPGVYLPGQFGVRIEDVCLAMADECRVLSEFPRELIRVG